MNKTNTADLAWEAGNEWMKSTDRWEKLDYLMETASPEFKDNIVLELMKFMGEHNCNEFFDHLRRNWGVLTPPELDYAMNS